MTLVTNCHACGARLHTTAQWCSQCYTPIAPEHSPPAPTRAVTERSIAPPAPPAPPAPSAPADPRFGAWTPDQLTAPRGTAQAVQTLARDTPSQAPSAVPAREPDSPIAHPALLVGTAIALGGAFQLFFWLKSRDWQIEPSTAIRYSLIGTLAFYVVILLIVLYQMRLPLKPLVWSRAQHPIPPILIGLGVGAGTAGLVIGFQSWRAGRLRTDDFSQLVVSEHDVVRTAVVFLLLCVAAPVVEEILFRGVLFEWLSHRDVQMALTVSGLAFALWHWRLNLWSIVYYAAIGGTLARLYFKRGLLSSMAGHAAFNGTLLAVAISLSMAAGPHVSAGGVAFTAPQGWKSVEAHTDQASLIAGPSGSLVGVVDAGLPGAAPDPQRLADEINSGDAAQAFASLGGTFRTAYVSELPSGPAVIVPWEIQGQSGQLVYVLADGHATLLMFQSGGSARATKDFAHMLNTLRVR